MQHKSHDFLASPEGLAERFNRPPVHYPIRVLDFRGDLVPAGEFDPPVYQNVEYKVQLQPEPGDPVEIRWMPVGEWRVLVGMPNAAN